MKKVVFVLSHLPNPRIIKRIDSLINDYRITVIFWNRNSFEQKFLLHKNVDVIQIKVDAPMGKPFKRILPLISFRKHLNIYLNKIKPDLLHIANLDMLISSRKFYKNNKHVRIIYEIGDLGKYVFSEDEPVLVRIIYKSIAYFEKITLKKYVSFLILASEFFWDEYYSKIYQKENYLTFPNVPRKSLFEKYSKKDHEIFTIGFIGSVRYFEEIKALIDVIKELDFDAQIMIAGTGPSYDAVNKYITENNLLNVEMYGAYEYSNEIVKLYEKIDLVYSVYNSSLANVKYAFPNRLYEAINAELPILVAHGTSLSNFVKEKGIGLSVKSRDLKDLKAAITSMVKNKQQYQKFVENTKKIKFKYQYEHYDEVILKIYRSVLSK